jgi:hypothetical protein
MNTKIHVWDVYHKGTYRMTAQCDAKMDEQAVKNRLIYDEGLPETIVVIRRESPWERKETWERHLA